MIEYRNIEYRNIEISNYRNLSCHNCQLSPTGQLLDRRDTKGFAFILRLTMEITTNTRDTEKTRKTELNKLKIQSTKNKTTISIKQEHKT